MNLKCIYCSKSCIESGGLLIGGLLDKLLFVQYRCENCKVFHYFTRDGGLIYVTWEIVTINNYKFLIRIYPEISIRKAKPIFSIYSAEKDHEIWTEVIRWNWIPNWEPTNYIDKLKTCLTFY